MSHHHPLQDDAAVRAALDQLEKHIEDRERAMNAQLRDHMNALTAMHRDADELRARLGIAGPVPLRLVE